MALPLIWGARFIQCFWRRHASLLSGEAVAEILRQVRMLLPLDLNAEITLEANRARWKRVSSLSLRMPASIVCRSHSEFQRCASASMGRIHSVDEAKRAIEIAQQHFDNINLDLMYALPKTTLEQALQDMPNCTVILTAASVLLIT